MTTTFSPATDHPWIYFQSLGGVVTLVGSNERWDDFQSELDFFGFHGGRIGQMLKIGNLKRCAYHADGNTFGSVKNQDGGSHGVFASGTLEMREVLAELG